MTPFLWRIASEVLGSVPSALAATTTDGNNNPTPDGDNTQTTRIQLFNPLKDMTLGDLLNTILQGLTILAIPVVTVMIIIGAYYLITSAGSADKVKKGKDYILWAVVGFAILLLASSVTAIITNFLS